MVPTEGMADEPPCTVPGSVSKKHSLALHRSLHQLRNFEVSQGTVPPKCSVKGQRKPTQRTRLSASTESRQRASIRGIQGRGRETARTRIALLGITLTGPRHATIFTSSTVRDKTFWEGSADARATRAPLTTLDAHDQRKRAHGVIFRGQSRRQPSRKGPRSDGTWTCTTSRQNHGIWSKS